MCENFKVPSTFDKVIDGTKKIADLTGSFFGAAEQAKKLFISSSSGIDPEEAFHSKALLLDITQKAIDLSQAHYALQDRCDLLIQEKAALTEENGLLKTTIGTLKDFESKAGMFVLREISHHSFAYVKKENTETQKGTAFYCQTCFDDQKLSVFQFKEPVLNHDALECPRRKMRILVHHGNDQVRGIFFPDDPMNGYRL